MLHLYDDKDEE